MHHLVAGKTGIPGNAEQVGLAVVPLPFCVPQPMLECPDFHMINACTFVARTKEHGNVAELSSFVFQSEQE